MPGVSAPVINNDENYIRFGRRRAQNFAEFIRSCNGFAVYLQDYITGLYSSQAERPLCLNAADQDSVADINTIFFRLCQWLHFDAEALSHRGQERLSKFLIA